MQLPHQPDDWTTEYTIDAFNEFRVSTNMWDPGTGRPMTVATPKPTGFVTDLVSNFKKGIKRDPTLFESLKDQKQWDVWWINTKAQAQAPGVHEVLMPNYKPTGRENIC